MKVLLTATVQSHIVQFHKPLVEALHENGCEVHVAAKDNLAEKNGLKLDFADKVFNVPFSRSPKSIDNIKAYKQLKKIIREGNYDVIHCNTPMGGIITRLAARKVRKRGAKVIYTVHGFHFYKGAPKKNWLVFYPIEKLFSRLTDTIITINFEDYNLAKNRFHCNVAHIHGVGADEKRFYPIAPEERVKLREELGFGAEDKIILCVGELLPNKNQKMAIQMMQDVVKKHPDAKLILAGNGREKENLQAEIAACGLENSIIMIGYFPKIEEYHRISDLLVSCSRREGLPLNLIEAMLTANPVVTSKNRGHNELVKNGVNGYLVASKEEMAQKVIELLDDECKRKEMGKNGRELVKDYCSSNIKREVIVEYL